MAVPKVGGKYVASGPGHKKKNEVISSGASSISRVSSAPSPATQRQAGSVKKKTAIKIIPGRGVDDDEEEVIRRRPYTPREINIPDYHRSSEVRKYQEIVRQMEGNRPADYTPSADVLDYQRRLKVQEANKPGAFQSRYSPQIESILQGIMNRPAFDISKDANYKQLYEQMKEGYMAQGDRAMRDTMGQAATLTGGYGSSYAVSAAGQAYNDYLQKLNAQNINLMNMAYGMYADDRSNDYSKLNAVLGLDNTDYGRYRDTVGDYYQDLNYLANRYSGEYDRDYGKYRDKMSDYLNDRNYYANRYATEYANDYGQYRDRLGFENDALTRDYQQYRDEIQQLNLESEMRHRKAQDALAQRNFEREFRFKEAQAAQQQWIYTKKVDTKMNTKI